jgi:hypothetical protein
MPLLRPQPHDARPRPPPQVLLQHNNQVREGPSTHTPHWDQAEAQWRLFDSLADKVAPCRMMQPP